MPPDAVKWIPSLQRTFTAADRGRVAAPGRDHPVEVEDVDPPAAGRGARRRHLAHRGVVEVHPGRRVLGPGRPRGLGPAVVVGRRHEDNRRPLRPQHVDGLPEAARQIGVEGRLADVLPPAPDLLVEGLAACGVHDDVGVVAVDPVPPGGEDGVRIPAVTRSARGHLVDRDLDLARGRHRTPRETLVDDLHVGVAGHLIETHGQGAGDGVADHENLDPVRRAGRVRRRRTQVGEVGSRGRGRTRRLTGHGGTRAGCRRRRSAQRRALERGSADGHQGAGDDRTHRHRGADGQGHPGAPRREHAAADRHLNEVVAEGGDGHRDADPGQEERVDAPVQPLARHDQEHRPVPEVDAVGDATPLGQWRQLQEAHDQRSRGGHAADDDRAGGQAGHHEAAAEGEGRGLRGGAPQRSRTGGAEDAEHGGGRAEPGSLRALVPQGQPDGDGRADQQGLRPAVGAVVGPRRVAVGGEEGHGEGGRQRAQARHREQRVQAAPAPCVTRRRTRTRPAAPTGAARSSNLPPPTTGTSAVVDRDTRRRRRPTCNTASTTSGHTR